MTTNKIKIFFLFILILLFACGCNVLSDCYVKKIDPIHAQSCGPEAIQEALMKHYRADGVGFKKGLITLEEISQEIRGEGSPLRCLVSFFNGGARAITWPSEIRRFFEDRGYEINKIKNLNSLSKSDIALVLVHKKNKITSLHWISFSEGRNIKSYFGKETVIDLVYIITKSN